MQQSHHPRKGKKRGDIHKIVIGTLKSKDGMKGDFLSKLRRKRNDADYDMDLAVGKDDANYAINLAKRITV